MSRKTRHAGTRMPKLGPPHAVTHQCKWSFGGDGHGSCRFCGPASCQRKWRAGLRACLGLRPLKLNVCLLLLQALLITTVVSFPWLAGRIWATRGRSTTSRHLSKTQGQPSAAHPMHVHEAQMSQHGPISPQHWLSIPFAKTQALKIPPRNKKVYHLISC